MCRGVISVSGNGRRLLGHSQRVIQCSCESNLILPLWYATQCCHSSHCAFQAGDKCGVIGTERSGKTTLLHMILRLFDPSHGKVELDGISLVAFKVRELRRCFGYVSLSPCSRICVRTRTEILTRELTSNACRFQPFRQYLRRPF